MRFILLFCVWVPLAYVLYGSGTGEPLYSGWVVSIIVLFSYVAASVAVSGGKNPVTPTSKYAIFNLILVSAALFAVIERYHGMSWDPRSLLSPAAWLNNPWGMVGIVALTLLCVLSWSTVRDIRKELAQEIEEVRLAGISVEALRKKQKDAQDLDLSTEDRSQISKADKEYQDAKNSDDKNAVIGRIVALKIEQLEVKRVADLRAKGKKCRDSRKPFCTWCGVPVSSMKVVREKQQSKGWRYKNMDGSRDHRIKDNYRQWEWLGAWKCDECDAITLTRHYASRHRHKSKVRLYQLESEGSEKGESNNRPEWILDVSSEIAQVRQDIDATNSERKIKPLSKHLKLLEQFQVMGYEKIKPGKSWV